MVGLTHIQQLTVLVEDMKDKGILDNKIDAVLTLQSRDNAFFVINLINYFYSDTETAIPEIQRLLSQEAVNYARVKNFAIIMKGGSACLGGCRMAQACQELRLHCDLMNKERCLELLDRVEEEFETLRHCLDSIAEIVRNILISGAGFGKD